MFRRSVSRLGGEMKTQIYGGRWGNAHQVKQHCHPSQCRGLLGHVYNDEMVFMRFIDPLWIVHRIIHLGRDNLVGFVFFTTIVYHLFWKWRLFAMWGDKPGKFPRDLKWNEDKAGYLPEGFQKTVL